MKVSFPTVCHACGLPIDGPFTGLLRAGEAWKDGYAILENGAHIYTTEAYHPSSAPPPVEQDYKIYGLDAPPEPIS